MSYNHFDRLIRICEKECESNWSRATRHLETVLLKIFHYIDNELDENPEINLGDVYKEIEQNVQTYLVDISQNNVKNKTIEYYLCKRAFSDKSQLRKKYDKLVKLVSKKDFNPSEYDFSYSFNMEQNIDKLLLKAILIVRQKQYEIMEQNPEMIEKILAMGPKSSKERIRLLKQEYAKMKNANGEDIKFDEKSYRYLFKPEYELIEEMLIDNFDDIRKYLKEDCINCITKSVKILDL